MKALEKFNQFNITTIIAVVVILFISVSCSKFEEEKIEAIADRSALPQLSALDITSIISDSGVTRFRISTPKWDVYDKAAQPYWEFPMGIRIEQFDESLKIDANIQSDYAKYLTNQDLWELTGNVKMTNIKGEHFESEQLFWDKRMKKIYSDSLVKITQPNSVGRGGTGFESNEQMTKYSFKNASSDIYIEDK